MANTPTGTSTVGYNAVADQMIGLDGGLDVNTDPFVLDPPFTTTATDMYFESPGQVLTVPYIVPAVPNGTGATLNRVYAGGALPTLEPFTTGAGYEILEYETAPGTGVSPQLNIRDWTSQDPKGPIAPIYPFNTRTRQLFGNVSNYQDGSAPGTTPSPYTACSASSPLNPTQVVTVYYSQTASAFGNTISIWLTDVTGDTTAQTLPVIQPTNVGQVRLIADSVNPNTFYLLLLQYNGILAQSVLCYTITTPSSGSNPSVSTPFTVTGPAYLGSSTNLACAIDTAYENGVPYLYFIGGASSGTLFINRYPLNPTSAATFNPALLFSYPGAVGSVLNLTVDSTFNLNTTTGGYYTAFGYGNNFAVWNTATSAFVSRTAVPYTPITVLARPLSGSTGFKGAVFGHQIENWTGLTSLGFTTAAQYTQQVVAGYFTSTSGGVPVVTPFRTQQGATIVSKAFTYNSNGQGFSTDSVLCPILLGSNGLDGVYINQSYFVIDQFARVASRFSEGSTPAVVPLTTTNPGNVQLPALLSQPLWLPSPNDGSLFEVGFPFLVPNAVTTTTASQAIVNPAVGTSTIPLTPLEQSYGGSITLFLTGYQAQGAVPPPVRFGKALLLSGMQTMEYDNRTLHESAFHLPAQPVGSPFNSVVGTGTNQTAGVYQYSVIYTWTDATGMVHRSAPSAVRYNNNSAAFDTVQMTISQPQFTYKVPESLPGAASANVNSTYTSIVAEVYRQNTANNFSGILYYVGSVQLLNGCNAPISGNYGDLSSVFTDVSSGLTNVLTLYTDNDQEYESDPPPPFIWQVNSQGRAFGLACVAGTYRVYYSSVYNDIGASGTVATYAPKWNGSGFLVAPAELGDCRSLAAMDDKILVFGTNAVGVFNGSGPDITASGSNQIQPAANGFSALVPIPVPAGVVGCGSPITVPKGVVYQDRQGMMLMDRGLQTEFIGKTITDLTPNLRFGIPCLFPRQQFVVFPNAQGPSLIMDYNSFKWAQWSSIQGATSAYIRQDGTPFVVNITIDPVTLSFDRSVTSQAYTSAPPTIVGAVAPQVQVETPWIQIGQGVSGEGDIWEMVVLGKYFLPHTLLVETAFNYGPYVQTTTFQPGVDPTLPTFPYQYRVRPQGMARAQAIRYRLTIINAATGPTAPECARITALMLFAGNYRGLQRMGAVASR